MKNQFNFRIALWIFFSFLVQARGQNPSTVGSACGGVLELSSGVLDFSPADQNGQTPDSDFCMWVIKLPVASQNIQFQLTQIPPLSTLNLYSQEGHSGQFSILPIASLTTADINLTVETKLSSLIVIWTPSRVKNDGDDYSSLLSFTWDESSAQNEGQGQRSGQDEGRVDQVKDLNLNLIGGVNYVEADRGRFSWAKPGKSQQTLLWVLNSKSVEPLDLKIEAGFENCDLVDPCLCSYFGVYEVYDNFLRAVSTECGRSSSVQLKGIRPRLVALGFVNPEFRRDTNHVTLSWNGEEPNEGTTTTTEITITTTEEPKTCSSGFPKSCSEIQFKSSSNSSQLQSQNWVIYPGGPGGDSLQVLCDFEVDGRLFKKGPADLVKNLHRTGLNASDFYQLSLSGFSRNSTAGDAMADHNEMRFSTVDKDNDNRPDMSCAVHGGSGGWWFSSCGYANLNGGYYENGESVPFEGGVYWDTWHGGAFPTKKSEMKIRTRK